MSPNPRVIYTIAKKEFQDNVRNKWITAMAMVFIILAIAATIMVGEGRIGSMEETVSSIMGISSMLIPVLGIMLGYSTIAGEVESGALSVVLSYPIKRGEVLIGKFLGLGAVLSSAIFVGFGAAGIVLAAGEGGISWGGYIGFILLTILLGLMYISMSMMFSAMLKKRSTALGAGIMVFFWAMIVGIFVMGIYVSTGGSMAELMTQEGIAEMPDWFWSSIFLSPIDGNMTAVMLVMGVNQFFGFNMEPPSFITLWNLVTAQLLWTFVPLLIGYVTFNRRDI